MDAAGRIASVSETVDGVAQTTTYTYDAFDNLHSVEQGDQTRTFQYDALGHLTGATNPESGTVNYRYDN